MRFLTAFVLGFVLTAGLAAQDMGRMTTYYMVFLKKGPKWTGEQTPEVLAIHKGHMEHLSRMSKSGKMILAGPFLDGGDIAGVCIFATATTEEARAAASQDPAVQAGRFIIDVKPWMTVKGISAPPLF
jgi:uncharacterized protein